MRTLSVTAGLFVLAGLLCGPCSPRAAADDAGWGSVKGRVIFGGEKLPEPVEVDVTQNKDAMHCKSKGAIFSEQWVINPNNKGVRWAVVWLAPTSDVKEPTPFKNIHPDLKASKTPQVEMDQPCCKYEPHVLAMRTDQKVVFKNSAPVAHNVNYVGCGKEKNVILNPGDEHEVTQLTYSWTGMNVGCNLHGWMKAKVWVFDHPYFAVTDADGNFEIKNAPVGEFHLIVWEDAIGLHNVRAVPLGCGKNQIQAGQKITIKANEETKVADIALKPKPM